MTDPYPARPPAGWLLDPADPGLLRWWDGAAWTEFRRLREPQAPDVAPEPVPAPLPPVEPGATSVPWDGAGTVGRPSTAWGAASPPPESFASQFDARVNHLVTGLGASDGQSRIALYTGVRDRILATAGPAEQVVDVVEVALHDEHRSRTRVGAARVDADLWLTDRRLLLVVHGARADDAVVEIALGDVAGATGLTDGGLVLALDGEGPPLVVRAETPAHREPLQRAVVAALQNARPR